MSLAPGVRLGAYEISGVLGAGGMGEVYRAYDARLNRDVAIKILRGDVVPDGHSRIRFEREARAVAALSHPNILAIHDVGDQDGQFFLVTELLEGETLRARLERGALPWRKAVEIAIAMAEGLSAAHAKGIVHRDFKPANTFLTVDGRVKILDFGLAKLRESADPGEHAATATAAVTQSGELMGTAAYMAPEHVAGRPVDARADLFALGCVLHEMVAGTRPFARQTAAETMAAILKEEPADLPGASEALRGLIAHCLEKDPERRFQTARDLAFALRSLVVGPLKQHERPPQTSRLPKRLLQTLAIVTLLAAVGVATWFWRRERSGDLAGRAVTTRLVVDGPQGYSILPGTFAPEFSISPDGTKLAFVAISTAGERSLWIRPLGAFSAQRLNGTEGAAYPYWSPDSKSIAFHTGSGLKTTQVAGGAPQSICECFALGPGTWSSQGVIVFSDGAKLHRVAASGGLATAITALDESGGEILLDPYFLPDGQHFIYAALHDDSQKRAIYLQSLGSPERKSLLSGLAGSARNAMYTPPGFLLYTRQATLLAQELDLASMQLRGEPIAVADQLNVDSVLRAPFSVSANGVLVYHGGAASRGRNQLAWYERTGRRLATVGEPGQFWQIGLSPDDKRIVTERVVGDSARPDLWMLDLDGGVFSRLTFDPLVWEADAIWSPDSRRIVFSVEPFREMREIVVASGATTVLHRDTEVIFPDDWSRDGRFIAFGSGRRPARLLSMVGDRRVQSLNDSSFNKDEFHFSPDGRWIAYHSSESGRFEVYVASLGPVAEKRQVSRGGGGQPKWRSDGKELFFLTLDGRLMAVEMATGTTIEVGIPEVLFRPKVYGEIGLNQYAVSRDGKRFLINEVVTETAEKFNVVLNWHTDLPR